VTVPIQTNQKTVVKARKDLVTAYRTAIMEYTKAKQDDKPCTAC
jgi:hypothetical protein